MKDAIRALVEKYQQSKDAKQSEDGKCCHGRPLRPASAEDIQLAEQAGFPRELLDFYRECELANCIEFEQRIWSLENALAENRDYVPGCILFPHDAIEEDASLSTIQRFRLQVAISLEDFLVKFTNGTLINEPSYD